MRRNYNAQNLSVRHYQYFAWFTLGLAVLAGLSGDAFGSQDAAAISPAPARMVAAKPIAPAAKSAPFALAAADEASEAAEELPLPAADLAALTDPSRQSGGKDGAKPVRKTPGGPTPGQIDYLVASSRERSGSVDQGDEPALAS